MTIVIGALISVMDVPSLHVCTSSGGNFLHVLASRGLKEVLEPVIDGLMEVHGLQAVQDLLDDTQDA